MFVTATLGHFIDRGTVDLDAGAIADAIRTIADGYDEAYRSRQQEDAAD
jgi:hypothetical protein